MVKSKKETIFQCIVVLSFTSSNVQQSGHTKQQVPGLPLLQKCISEFMYCHFAHVFRHIFSVQMSLDQHCSWTDMRLTISFSRSLPPEAPVQGSTMKACLSLSQWTISEELFMAFIVSDRCALVSKLCAAFEKWRNPNMHNSHCKIKVLQFFFRWLQC